MATSSFPRNFGNVPMQGASAGSFGGDPALIQAQANINQSLAAAEQEALKEMRQLLIDYGDPEMAAKYLNEPATESDVWWLHNPSFGQGVQSGTLGGFPPMMEATPGAGAFPISKNMWGSFDWDPVANKRAPSLSQDILDQQADAIARQGQIGRAQTGSFYGSEADAQAAAALQFQNGSWQVTPTHQGRGIDVQAAMDNPYSVLKRLARQQQGEQFDANENLNKANLFYSSERGRVLKELGTDAQGRSYDAARAVQDQLNSIQNQLAGAQVSAQQQLAQQTLQSQQARNQQIRQSFSGGR